MVLQSSGAISLADIAAEFGGTTPHSLSEYYGSGSVPTSGTISFSQFYGQASWLYELYSYFPSGQFYSTNQYSTGIGATGSGTFSVYAQTIVVQPGYMLVFFNAEYFTGTQTGTFDNRSGTSANTWSGLNVEYRSVLLTDSNGNSI